MYEPDQFEGFDPEFCADWTGLEWQGFVPIVKIVEPTDTDVDEWRLSLENQSWVEEIPERPKKWGKAFDFLKCRQLAEVGLSSVEVAEVLGVEPYDVNNNIRAKYGCGWKEYSSRLRKALSGELRVRIIETCRRGSERALAMFAIKLLGGWEGPGSASPSYPSGSVTIEAGTSSMMIEPTEDLQKRRLRLMAVIDRRPAFEGLEQLTSTLKVVEGWHEISGSRPEVVSS